MVPGLYAFVPLGHGQRLAAALRDLDGDDLVGEQPVLAAAAARWCEAGGELVLLGAADTSLRPLFSVDWPMDR